MPARKYMAVDVEPDRYGEIFDQVIHNTISEKGMRLAGAVCDYTEPATGKIEILRSEIGVNDGVKYKYTCLFQRALRD